MFKRSIPEVLEEANLIEDPSIRAEFLNKHMRLSMAKCLAAIHNPDIVFDKFSGITYKKTGNKAGISDSTLDHETRRIYMFQKSSPVSIIRKKQRLTQMLESMYDKESEFLYEVLLPKKNPYKNINKNFIKKYFPNILSMNIEK